MKVFDGMLKIELRKLFEKVRVAYITKDVSGKVYIAIFFDEGDYEEPYFDDDGFWVHSGRCDMLEAPEKYIRLMDGVAPADSFRHVKFI